MTTTAYRPNKLSTFILFTLVFIVTEAKALPEDRELPLQVKAQSMQWNNQQQQATYQGDVEVHQGELVIEAANLKILRTTTGELKQAVANTPKGQAYMRDLPDPIKPEVEAWGEVIDYLPSQDLVILTGQARLIQGTDSFTGHKLVYNLVTQDIQAEQKSSSDTRVEVILTPAPKGAEK
ncbi:lipopolysaccharide transport periplasmic protein LptA [Marinospirillum insulare]|uniref:Lipopolysaccharide export system protein LptA n=1 Tax=Marinospirillum insulare TaxID=217169 RepID=A0ABQ5ZVX1_9GAMM|nr:lipopolysaccharide transport periplasmic protein LptA [Marinospirillum insulare]GLR63180.1 lipopolysaccharide export system protein LptA [Marinospirillum insulare]